NNVPWLAHMDALAFFHLTLNPRGNFIPSIIMLCTVWNITKSENLFLKDIYYAKKKNYSCVNFKIFTSSSFFFVFMVDRDTFRSYTIEIIIHILLGCSTSRISVGLRIPICLWYT
ncbi:hypothetical protein L9F63_014265, partial [Diploptera punctata]